MNPTRKGGRRRVPVDMESAVRRYADGVPKARIARDAGVSESTLRKRFKEIEGMPMSALSRGSVLVNDGRSADH